MKQFNVIIEDNGKFISYDIMPYLLNEWNYWNNRVNELEEESDYWVIPKSFDEIKEWVRNRLQYQYWSRCQYEIVLYPWPSGKYDNGYKIDIYEQCLMNLDIITEVFIYNIQCENS